MPMRLTAPNATEDDAQDVPGAQALLRGIDLLLAISTAPSPPRFRDLEKTLKIPRATLHRLLAALSSRNLLRYDERAKTYEVGMRVLELSRRALDKSGIIRAAKPEVTRLARRLQRTMCLMVLDGTDVFVLDFEDYDASFGRLVRSWPRVSALETAAGHSLLAAMPRENCEKVLAQLPSDRRHSAEALLASLSITKALGYAIVARETHTGRMSVAAPIFDDTGYPLAALTVFFEPDEASAEDLHETGRILMEGAKRASGFLGIGFPTPNVTERPASRIGERVDVLPTGRDFVGENPVWNDRQRRLYWVDVLAPALRWWDPERREAGRLQLEQIVVGITFAKDDRMIAAGENGLSFLDWEKGNLSPLINPEADRRDNRFNTVAVDAKGRLWTATVALNHEAGKGSLYSFDDDLSVRRHLNREGTPKTVAFNSADTVLYLTDSSAYTVFRYSLDSATCRIFNRTIFVVGDVSNQPSGLTVDAEDHVWITFLGGWCVRRYAPDGKMVEEHILPMPMPTNCAFGGDDLSTLYITSTWLRLPPGIAAVAPASGQLAAIKTGTRGGPLRRIAYVARASSRQR